MTETADIIIVGLGANGSSALYHLSKTNKRVIGIDGFSPPHTYGSSHGESRIIRQAYHENTLYVPFVKQAYDLWHSIEEEANKKIAFENRRHYAGQRKFCGCHRINT